MIVQTEFLACSNISSSAAFNTCKTFSSPSGNLQPRAEASCHRLFGTNYSCLGGGFWEAGASRDQPPRRRSGGHSLDL